MEIAFSFNWNKKLDGQSFTTFRYHNTRKYKIGQRYSIVLKKKELGTAVILDIKTMKLSQVNEWIARIDTGYSRVEFVEMVMKMYKNIDENTLFDYILLEFEQITAQ